jgi:hypothetical protein
VDADRAVTSPVTEEAVRLVEALQGWFATSSGALPLATGGADCALCPLCRAIGVVRGARPEVVAHLTEASVALLAALRAALAAQETAAHEAATAQQSRVQHIDIGD